MTYVLIVEFMSEDDRKQYDRELPLAPGKKASRGTNQLMAAFGMATQ